MTQEKPDITAVPETILGLLEEIAAFRCLSHEQLGSLSLLWQRIELEMGDYLFHQGEDAQALFVIERGAARIVQIDEPTGSRRNLGRRIRGDLVGEVGVIDAAPRNASVRSTSDLSAWKLDRQDFLQFVKQFPEIRKALTLNLELIQVRTFLESIRQLMGLTPANTRTLADRLERMETPPDSSLVRTGEDGVSMFFIYEGEALVYEMDPQRQQSVSPIRSLQAGDYFGERSLLTGDRRNATVVSKTPMILYRLNRSDFESLLGNKPSIRQELVDEVSRYMQQQAMDQQHGVPLDIDSASSTPETSSFIQPSRIRRLLNPFLWGAAHPVVLQHNEMDCGAACLTSVLQSHGRKQPLSWVRDQIGTSREGSSLEALVQAASSMGFKTATRWSNLAELRSLENPAILFWQGSHFTVLVHASKDRVQIMDPAIGIRTLPVQEFINQWTGIHLALTPTADLIEPLDHHPQTNPLHQWLLGIGSALKYWLALLFLEALATLGLIYLFGTLAQSSGPSPEIIFRIATLAVTWMALQGSCPLFFDRGWLHWSITAYPRFLNQFFSLPETTWERLTLHDVILHSGSVERVRTWARSSLAQWIREGLILTGISFHLIASAPFWGILFFLATALSGSIWYAGFLRFRSEAASSQYFLHESANRLNHVLLRQSEYRLARLLGWALKHCNQARRSANARIHSTQWSIWVSGVVGVTPFVTLWILAQSTSKIGGFFLLEALLLPYLTWKILSSLLSHWTIQSDLDRIKEILDTSSEKSDSEILSSDKTPPLAPTPPTIQVQNLHAPMSRQNHVGWLRGINLHVGSGKSLATVGPPDNGSWELLRILDSNCLPSEIAQGSLERTGPDGLSMSECRVHTITQNPLILPISIRENILLSSAIPSLGNDLYQTVLELLRLPQLLSELPEGEKTQLERDSQGIDCGLGQRIQFARALYSRPDLLIAYRPLSDLPSGERWEILRDIIRFLRDHTTFIFAPSSPQDAREADEIALLVDGRLLECQNHEYLKINHPVYNNLLGRD